MDQRNARFIEELLDETGMVVDFVLDEQIWQQAARASVDYAQRRRRSRGGSPKRMLVDFIASHAVLRANRMMTLDANRSKQTSLVCGSSSSCAWAPPPC
jgi:hypothetical protein